MKNILRISSAVVFVLLQSCNTQMYVSNAVNAPLLKEKGEVQAVITQNDLQVAVGLNRNIGVMANGFFRNYKSNGYEHGGFLGEVGLGYYTMLSDKWVAEAFVGLGGGRVFKQKEFTDSRDLAYMGSFEARAARLFIQPDLGYRSKVFDMVLTPRFSFVKYTSFTSTDYPNEELENDYLDGNRLTGPLFMFAEPTLTFRLGYKYVKLQAQYGLTVNLTPHDIKHTSNFSSLGIVLNIAKWYNNTSTEEKIKKTD